ncbi:MULTISPECIES: 50S ribosomal protein L15 [Persicobacter]|uniref:Large ribosomal subunit protein uL15 n=1 Tax=Persicobacter diffluens TaxID=981 RepID=A0AAN4VYZ4_9BACT|nr:50S ribosomal protein L15 [Persicobacter sp. CCB-QB2]GJM62047.1 50S ribosomal protein L15 [Persicobacter diffluens]
MKLHTLKPAERSVKAGKRIGRGQGSTRGGTSTRGHKGAKSRSGYSQKIGFEGGQMPLQRRVPKFGFTNPNRVIYKPVNLDAIQALADKLGVTAINVELMRENGIVGKSDLVKVLANGALTAKVDVTANKFSASAVELIEKAGGTATVI